MKKKSNQSAILRDHAVFNYVSGNQSAESQERFAEKMLHDEELRNEVEFEKSLRERFAENASIDETNTFVSEGNFDKLMERIDNKRDNEIDKASETNPGTHLGAENRALKKPKRLNPYYAIAASVLVVSAVTIGVVDNLYAPKFVTLSDQTASQKIDFNALVENRQLAKIVLKKPKDAQSTSEFLAGYQLQAISSSPQKNTIIVRSQQSIDQLMLAGWRADQRVTSAQIIQFSDGEK